MSHLLKTTVALFLLLFAFASQAASPVWRISKGGHHLYIGGTIHLLSKSDYPLPKSFNHAYQDAHVLVFETDMAAMQSFSFLMKMNQVMTFSNGQTLKSSLKAHTYNKLQQYFKHREMPAEAYALYTPVGITMLISFFELQRIGLTPEFGVDHHFATLAKKDGKPLGELETPDEHLSYIANMAAGKEDELILKTLEELEQTESIMQELKAAWKIGNHKKLNTLAIKEMKTLYPKIYASLLVERNNNWMPKIENMMKNKEVELVLVGALHLVGSEGLIQQLKQNGYKVENL
ncbi:MAG: TraB/GumN family protein [Agarilytica sp.]